MPQDEYGRVELTVVVEPWEERVLTRERNGAKKPTQALVSMLELMSEVIPVEQMKQPMGDVSVEPGSRIIPRYAKEFNVSIHSFSPLYRSTVSVHCIED